MFGLTELQRVRGLDLVPFAVAAGEWTATVKPRPAGPGQRFAVLLDSVAQQPPAPWRHRDAHAVAYEGPVGDAAGAADAAAAFTTQLHVLKTHAQVFAGDSHTLGRPVDKVGDALPVASKSGQRNLTREPATVVTKLVTLGAWGEGVGVCAPLQLERGGGVGGRGVWGGACACLRTTSFSHPW